MHLARKLRQMTRRIQSPPLRPLPIRLRQQQEVKDRVREGRLEKKKKSHKTFEKKIGDDANDEHQNWAAGRSFAPRLVTELKAVKEGPKVNSMEEALRMQMTALVAANRELKAASEKSKGATADTKSNDAKAKKLE